jgi:hypothetical protein
VLIRSAIRQMAFDLHEYERARLGDLDEAVDRTVVVLGERLGRHPTAGELATAAGLDVEDVLEAWLRRE